MKKRCKKWLAAVLALACVLGSAGTMPVRRAEAAGEGGNLIKNPNFENGDLSMWMDTGAVITAESQEEEICSGVKTYATISGRTQSYQGFSQDVTDVVQPGKEYEVSFYVRLSEEYEGLPDSQRQVFFGPFVVVDGTTRYLNQSYSGEITGDLIREVPAGQWVQLSGVYKVAEDAEQVVVRFQEESSAGMGSYSITGVSMREAGGQAAAAPQTPAKDDGLPRLKDAIQAALGEDTMVGMVTHPLNNKKEWALAQRHANALTTGNELKPDFLFSYSCDNCPGTETVNFNGKPMLVPKITNFAAIDAYLDEVLRHNEAYPDDIIRMKGHVLVWHAQTPEWFFHEEYDPKKPYVTKEEMDRRLEWYISAVFGHFLGEGSRYRDLFYGWDVVNEACWDAAKIYRDDTVGNDKLTDSRHSTKSSWWHVYQSNEFIINAFKYANKYAPAGVELYYNDYGETNPSKMVSICELLRAVKEQEGAPGVGTRIDAFGMQAHYGLGDFNIQDFENAARAYLDIVGKIELSEFDMGASSNYDGTMATRDQEYQDQALCFQKIFETLVKLDSIDGYEVGGITFWGVIDTTSWLQNKSDLGGGSDGLRSQCPLLFDGNYEAKPAFWAFVDPSRIEIVKKKVRARRVYDGKFDNGEKYSFTSGAVSAVMTPVWDEEGLKIQVEVQDSSADKEGDYVTVYLDREGAGRDGITPLTVRKARGEGSSNTNSYKSVLTVPLSEIRMGGELLFDVTVRNGDEILSFNDIRGNQESSSRNYARVILEPALTKIHQGTVTVDGEMDEVWNTAETLWLNVASGSPKAAARAKVLWDKEKCYIYAQILDGDLNAAEDSLEIYIDEDYGRTVEYAKDDKRYRISCGNEVTCQGKKAEEKNVQSAVKKVDGGYVIEASIDWTDVVPKVHKFIGFDLKLNDADASGKGIGTLSWCDGSGDAESSAACFGTLKIAVEGEPKEESGNPDAAYSAAKVWSDSPDPAEEPKEEEPQAPDPLPDQSGEPQDSSKGVPKGLLAALIAVILASCAAVYCKKRGREEQKPGEKEEDRKDPKEELEK